MKKLTKTQQEIERLAKRLPKPTDAFRRFDKRIRAQKDYNDSCEVYESFCSIMGKYAVERTFQVGKDYFHEVAQWWCDTESGKMHYREKHSSLLYGGNYGYLFKGYDNDTPFQFKSKSGMQDKYGYQFCKPYQKGKARLTKVLALRGASMEDLEEFGVEKVSRALADSRMETILKHSYRFFYWMLKNNRELTDAVWSAYKITIRNHYRIRNMEMWYDMIQNMAYLGIDYRNPRYVCPKAYKRFHDEIVEKANRRRERERTIAREKAEREKAERNKAFVEERMSRFSDLFFENGTLHSVVMITYDDYLNEGTAMHHCVSSYFGMKDSLILSMRDKDGKRIETVEVNLRTFSITQSRGLQNKATSRHEEIIDLVNRNMWQIKERMTRMAS